MEGVSSTGIIVCKIGHQEAIWGFGRLGGHQHLASPYYFWKGKKEMDGFCIDQMEE